MSRSPRSTRALRRRIGVGVIGACLAGLWFGCSVERDYGVLSFFFDGVPDPNAAEPPSRARRQRRTGAIVSTHTPFRDRACRACHVTASEFGLTFSGYRGVKATVCLKCHADTVTAFPHMHGPVAGVQCLQCHEAHESRYPSLLVASGPELCLDCHSPAGGLLDETLDVHRDLTVDCLTCHHGHGGATAALLRPADPTESP